VSTVKDEGREILARAHRVRIEEEMSLVEAVNSKQQPSGI